MGMTRRYVLRLLLVLVLSLFDRVHDQQQITYFPTSPPTTTPPHDTYNTQNAHCNQTAARMALLERNLGSSGRRLLQLVQDHAAREPVRATLKGLVHHGRHARSKFVANNLRDQVRTYGLTTTTLISQYS